MRSWTQPWSGAGLGNPDSGPALPHSPSVWSGGKFITTLSSCFPSCKMGTLILTPQHCGEGTRPFEESETLKTVKCYGLHQAVLVLKLYWVQAVVSCKNWQRLLYSVVGCIIVLCSCFLVSTVIWPWSSSHKRWVYFSTLLVLGLGI